MKFRSLLAATALAAVATLGSNASATTAGIIGPDNEFLPGDDTLNGYFGANLYLTGGSADIAVTFLGSEAGFNNYFNFMGGIPGLTTFFTGGNDPGTGDFGNPVTQIVEDVSAGLLSFWFGVNGNVNSVENGSNPENVLGLANFFVSFVPDPNSTSGQSVLILFDDAGGGNEDNHDDMVIQLTIVGGDGYIAPVPLPAGGLLLIGALGGLALIRRRKST